MDGGMAVRARPRGVGLLFHASVHRDRHISRLIV